MKYRVEYAIIGTEDTGRGSQEFQADSDQQASSQADNICKEKEVEINKDIQNRFWHFQISFLRLVIIIQPEISKEVKVKTSTTGAKVSIVS